MLRCACVGSHVSSHSGVEVFLINGDISGLLAAVGIVSYMAEDDARMVVSSLGGSVVEENRHVEWSYLLYAYIFSSFFAWASAGCL